MTSGGSLEMARQGKGLLCDNKPERKREQTKLDPLTILGADKA